MGNTVAHPGPFDPLGRADPDQPFFPLMAGDEFAPGLVLDWADKTRRHARGIEDEAERKRLFLKANEAEEIAWAMQRWEATGEAADVRVAETRARYNTDAPPAAAEYQWRLHLTAGTQDLRDAAYNFTEAAAHLPPDQARAIAAAVAEIERIAGEYTPKRASYGEPEQLPGLAAGNAA